MPDAQLAISIQLLTAQIKILQKDVEALNKHMGSTGYFIQIALEELEKAVKELQRSINASP